jgi:hypothetical protein
MRKTAFGAVLLACLAGLVLAAQTREAEARRLGSFIPVTAGPWLSEADQVYESDSVPEGLPVSRDVLDAHRLRLMVVRRFVKDGQPDLLAAVCDMGSAESARAVFDRETNGRSAAIGPGSNYGAGLLVLWKGRYFVAVSTEKETAQTRELVLGLGRSIAAAIAANEERTKGS